MSFDPSEIEVRTLVGPDVATHLDALARLRITVFRDFPYLYDGSIDYERDYLRTYAEAQSSLFVVASHRGVIVGASTAISLTDAEAAFRVPFEDVGIAPERVLYFGESVLDAAYRGLGLGHRFFDAREAHAVRLGHDVTAFCAVERPPDHPRTPPGYRPLHPFWRARGYHREPALRVAYAWREIGEDTETEKPMVFWLRGASLASREMPTQG